MAKRRNPQRMGVPVHPGEILKEEFLVPLGLTQTTLAHHLGISQVRVSEIINGKRGISPETAWLLSEAFGTSPQLWTNLQVNYDLATHQPSRHVKRIRRAG
jgi:addiction module HigA family antidote